MGETDTLPKTEAGDSIFPWENPEPDRAWSDEDKVRFLYERRYSVSAICRAARIGRGTADTIIDAVDAEIMERMRAGGDQEKASHKAYLGMVAQEAAECYARSKRGGRIGNPRHLRIGVEAL